jgi:hypothetical protein
VGPLSVGALAEPVQPGGGELADRRRQPVADDIGSELGRHERLVTERLEDIEAVSGGAGGLGQVLECLEGEAADEHRRPGEQSLFDGLEQVERPGDRLFERLVALWRPGTGLAEQAEQVGEPVRHLSDGDRAHAGGRQLDRQGKAVDGSADSLDQRQGRGRHLEGRVGARRPVTEQLCGRRRPDRSGSVRSTVTVRVGSDGKRAEGDDELLGHAQPFTARRQDRERVATGAQRANKPGRLAQDVLAVVEDQECAASRKMIDERGQWVVSTLGARERRIPEDGGRHMGHHAGGPDVFEGDEMNVASERPGQFDRQLPREPGLAGASCGDERHDRTAEEFRSHLGKFGPPADETVGRPQDPDRGGVVRLERRKLVADPPGGDLEDGDRLGQIPQEERPERVPRCRRCQQRRFGHSFGGCDDLSRIRAGSQANDSLDS